MPFLSFQFKGAKIVRKGLENLRKKIPLISRSRIRASLVEMKKEMSVEGDEVVYPINWDSLKQMRAYFASDGFGKGIPYVRTQDTRQAFEIVRTELGYDFGNPLAHSRYLYGTVRSENSISNIHRGRYPILKRVYEKIIKHFPKSVRDALTTIARQEGFKTE